MSTLVAVASTIGAVGLGGYAFVGTAASDLMNLGGKSTGHYIAATAAGAVIGGVVLGGAAWVCEGGLTEAFTTSKENNLVIECSQRLPKGSVATITKKADGTIVCSPAP